MPAARSNPNLLRVLSQTPPDLLARMFAVGRLLEAEVVSVYRGRAMLAFGQSVRLEVALRAPLREGERVLLRVEPGGDGVVLRLAEGGARLDRLI